MSDQDCLVPDLDRVDRVVPCYKTDQDHLVPDLGQMVPQAKNDFYQDDQDEQEVPSN